MKEILYNIGTYLKIAFLGLGYIILRAGLNSGNHLFTIAGAAILIVVGTILVINLIYRKIKKREEF